MRILMLKRFEGLVRRSASVVAIVSDGEENKMEIMLDPVRASCVLTHTLRILFILQKHSGDGRAHCSHLIFFSSFFCFTSSGVRNVLSRGRCQAPRSADSWNSRLPFSGW